MFFLGLVVSLFAGATAGAAAFTLLRVDPSSYWTDSPADTCTAGDAGGGLLDAVTAIFFGLGSLFLLVPPVAGLARWASTAAAAELAPTGNAGGGLLYLVSYILGPLQCVLLGITSAVF